MPFDQDTRVARLTCGSCHRHNPPWGHVNSFTEARLIGLFPQLMPKTIKYAGQIKSGTNFISAMLNDFANNPWGTYTQEEPCIYCNKKFKGPAPRNALQKVATKIAFILNRIQDTFLRSKPVWIYVLFEKR